MIKKLILLLKLKSFFGYNKKKNNRQISTCSKCSKTFNEFFNPPPNNTDLCAKVNLYKKEG